MKRANILHNTKRMAFLAAAASLLTACAGIDNTGPKATATLEPRSGSTVSGTVSFQTVGQKVRVEASVAARFAPRSTKKRSGPSGERSCSSFHSEQHG